MKNKTTFSKHIYWMPESVFQHFKQNIKDTGFTLHKVISTPCETLRAKGNKIRYASPGIFSGMCNRQGSWYRNSDRAGKYLLVSEHRLPGEYHKYIDSTISETDFQPKELPDKQGLKSLVDSQDYQQSKPEGWENKSLIDSVMFKMLFSITGFWGRGDNLNRHWLNHRANHANFLSHQYTEEIDGEPVPYSVTGNDGVCSSCVEFFNIIDESSRKMVTACPGSVTFAGVNRNTYYDVIPVQYVTLESIQ